MEYDFSSMTIEEIRKIADIDIRIKRMQGTSPLPDPVADDKTRSKVKAARLYLRSIGEV